jgi:CRISPR-associated protein Csd1
VILQELVRYYDRRSDLAPEGWEYKEIPFFLELTQHGNAALVDRRSPEWRRGPPLLVPASEIRSGKNSWQQPNLLWDHYGFVLGEPKRLTSGENDPTDNPEKAGRQLVAFQKRVAQLKALNPHSPGLDALTAFYAGDGLSKLQMDPLFGEMLKLPGANITFRLSGSAESILEESWLASGVGGSDPEHDGESDAGEAICLVSGEQGTIARLHPKIPGVASKPAALVSLNTLENPSFGSYGKSQAFNAPVSVAAASKYSTALRHLLAKDSRNRVQVGDASAVFWADAPTPLADGEFNLADILGAPPDDPDRGVLAVQALYRALHSGQLPVGERDVRFFVLGLAPNAARISVRFWVQSTVAELAPRIQQHFDDLRIVQRYDSDPPVPSLFRLLTALALQGKVDNVPPRLAGEWMRAILEGLPCPALLLNAAVIRCKAEREVSYLRAAMLKAWLNRDQRRRHKNLAPDHAEFKEELDMQQTDAAYRLGRLFAVLERIQQKAQPGINATIRDRYYGAASTTPVAVFTTLLRLKNAHLKKLADGEVAHFERLLGEVFGSLEAPALSDFPRQLNLPDQGRFALGYYHQRQSFFRRKTDAEPDPTDDTPDTDNTTQD